MHKADMRLVVFGGVKSNNLEFWFSLGINTHETQAQQANSQSLYTE
jgi:hypothetical protein